MAEKFIAKRYLRSKHKINFIGIISILSTLGISIGVAALVIVISVFNGFSGLITSMLTEFDPHIRITSSSGISANQANTLDSVLSKDARVKSIVTYKEGDAVLFNSGTYQLLKIKGVDSLRNSDWGISKKLNHGSIDIGNSEFDEIIISLPIALRLSVVLRDTISVISTSNVTEIATSFAIPKVQKFIVSGIFETNNKEYDYRYAFTKLRSSEILFDNNISGIEVRLNSIEDSEKLKEEIIALGSSLNVYTWFDLHKELYQVMVIERWSAYLLLLLIILVSAFNIISSLTMTIIEKRKDIGILRTLGFSSISILKIFRLKGFLIGITGTLSGLALGLFVCFLQINFKIYPLDPFKYIIDSLPMEVNFLDILIISLVSFLLSFVASIIPAKAAVRTNIIESIKWE